MINKRKNHCFIIAEVAQSHDGNLETAHAYIDAIASTGVDAVKFQTHIAHAESSPEEPWRIKFNDIDATRYDYWQRMEFSQKEWSALKKHAEDKKLVFLSSPFSVEAIELLLAIGIKVWKVASGEINNPFLLEAMIQSKLPIILSSGMSAWEELDETIVQFQKNNCEFSIMQCTSTYPCPPEKTGLNIMQEMRQRYKVPVGLSDHSGNIYAGLAAVSLGAELLEVHVTLDKSLSTLPDNPVSLTVEQLAQLAEGVRFIETALANSVDKDKEAFGFSKTRNIFMQSLVAKENIPSGTVLKQSMLTSKKPGIGVLAKDLSKILDKKVTRTISKDEFIKESDIENG